MLKTVSTLTERQRAVLEYIKWFQEECGVGPSYQEIMEKMGLHSKSGVHRVITELVDRGVLRKAPYRPRQYTIVNADLDEVKSLLRRVYPYLTYEVPLELREQVRAAL